MTIRPARPSDRDELLRMRQSLWPDSDEPEVDVVLAGDLRQLVVLVAERAGPGLCAFAEIGIRPYAEGCLTSPVAYLEGIWVDPDARRRAVGSGLIREAVSWARSLGLRELASDCDLHNRASLGFHATVGFTEVERIVCFRLEL